MAKNIAFFLIAVIFVGCLVVGRAAWNEDLTQEVVVPSWSQWIAHVVSRGIYLVLICLITLCIAVTTYRNKYGETARIPSMEAIEGRNKWVDTVWKAASSNTNPLFFGSTPVEATIRNILYRKGELPTSDLEERLREQLLEAQITVTALKDELEEANRARLELEVSVESLDKEKNSAEDLLETQKCQDALEMEKLKRENDFQRRQLQKTIIGCSQEKDQLGKEVESLQRDARIVASALRDNQLMDERLEEARLEIAHLKKQLEEIRVEKDIAVKMVEEIMQPKERGSGANHIETSISNSIVSDQVKILECGQDYSKFLELFRGNVTEEELCNAFNVEDGELGDMAKAILPFNNDGLAEVKMMGGDGPSLSSFSDETLGYSDSQLDISVDYEIEHDTSGLVTGSDAFRKFLETNFSPLNSNQLP